MSIKFTKSFACSDGNVFGSISLAQEHELVLILKEASNPEEPCGPEIVAKSLAVHLLTHADKIVDILTTKTNSKPAARRINGGRKPRKTVIAANDIKQ